MKKLMIPALAVLVAALAGCVQIKMATDIAKDGSGTYTMTYSVSQEVEQTINEMRALGGDMAEQMDEAPDFADFDRDDFTNKIGKHGVKLVDYSNEVRDGRRTVVMKLSYPDLKALSEAMGGSFGGSGGGMKITKNGAGDYVLASYQVQATEEAETEEEAAPEDMNAAMQNAAKSMELMGRLMAHISEMSMAIAITLPGDIVESNAHRVEGRTCIWEINANNMMQAEGMEPHVVFSGKGLSIKTAE
ncbi:MAG: hypothetical protein IPH09_17760 [bacterium]|nr:hypothetical protein [bacterium]